MTLFICTIYEEPKMAKSDKYSQPFKNIILTNLSAWNDSLSYYKVPFIIFVPVEMHRSL